MQMKHHLLTTGGLHTDTYTQAIHNLNAGKVADLSPGLITCWDSDKYWLLRQTE